MAIMKRQNHVQRTIKHSCCEGRPNLRGRFSEWLIKWPFRTILVIIAVLAVIAFFIRLCLQCLEIWAKARGYQWLSLNGSLGNWFAFFGSYCGVIATVTLGVLAVRLTIKQDQSKGYADISDLVLSDFALYDLWRYYLPSSFGEDPGRRFVLTFQIKGLKMYYSVQGIEAFWCFTTDGNKHYVPLINQKVKQEETEQLKIMLCFDDFDGCSVEGSFNYFVRLGCYEPKMMSLSKKRCWLKLRFKIHYADGSCVRYVDCEYCLQHGGVADGHVSLNPVDHVISISSRRVKE